MENIFKSIFDADLGTTSFFIVLGVSFVLGLILSLISFYKSNSSKHFYLAIALIPLCTAMIIMLINGNIGAGVAVLGAFGLVRFRSGQGNAREITIIFISMTLGFVMGMGYIAYAVIFTIIVGIVLIIMTKYNFFTDKSKGSKKQLRITIPETLDYNEVFTDIFEKYTNKIELIRSKTSNMGSLYVLCYEVSLKDKNQEKSFIDELRCRNGNLEIVMERPLIEEREL